VARKSRPEYNLAQIIEAKTKQVKNNKKTKKGTKKKKKKTENAASEKIFFSAPSFNTPLVGNKNNRPVRLEDQKFFYFFFIFLLSSPSSSGRGAPDRFEGTETGP
jgi:hypothetical protein